MTCFNFRSTPMKAYQTFFFRPAYVGMCSHTACMRSRRLGTKPKRGSRYNSSLVFVFLCWRVQCYKAAYAERKATAFLPLSTGHVSFLQVRGRKREEESTCKALKKVKKKEIKVGKGGEAAAMENKYTRRSRSFKMATLALSSSPLLLDAAVHRLVYL